MADFQAAYAIVMHHEGGYANDPDDNGGETYKGIAREFHPDWKGWHIIDAYKSKPNFPNSLDSDATLQSLVLAFYKNEFWDISRLDEVKDQAIAVELFDTGVNMHHSFAGKFLQRVLNASNRNGKDYSDLTVDGKIGPATIAALNKHQRPKDVLKVLNCLQGARYMDLIEKKPVYEKFFRSWFSRVSL